MVRILHDDWSIGLGEHRSDQNLKHFSAVPDAGLLESTCTCTPVVAIHFAKESCSVKCLPDVLENL